MTEPAEINSNDRAFIKISEEIRRNENSLLVLEAVKKVANRLDAHYKTNLRELSSDRAYPEEIQEWMKFIPYLTDDGAKLDIKIERTKIRLTELRELQEVYLKGGNILASKLAKD